MRAGRTAVAVIALATLAASIVLLVPLVPESITTPVTYCAVPPHGFGCVGTADGGHFPVSASIGFRLLGAGAVYADVPCSVNGSVTFPRFGSCGWTYSWQGSES